MPAGIVEAQHKKLTADLFNIAWALLEKKDRTEAENDRMIHAAHASRFHWGEAGTPTNFAIGEWQISRVFAVLGRQEPSIYHARRCLEICKEHQIEEYPLAYAYQALARAHAVAKDTAKAAKYVKLGRATGARIKEKDDRHLFFSDLDSVPAPQD